VWLDMKSTMGSVICSKMEPCFGVEFEESHLSMGVKRTENVKGTCKYVKERGVKGLFGQWMSVCQNKLFELGTHDFIIILVLQLSLLPKRKLRHWLIQLSIAGLLHGYSTRS
jgi:hypothetical protein